MIVCPKPKYNYHTSVKHRLFIFAEGPNSTEEISESDTYDINNNDDDA